MGDSELRQAVLNALTTTWAAWGASSKTVYERLEECADSVVLLIESGDLHMYDVER